MLLSLPAAAAACCSSVLLLCCCSAAQVQLVWLCNHWVRLHSCNLPVLLLKLLLMLSSSSMAWVGLKSSNFLCLFVFELASLGYLGLSTLNKYFLGKLNQLSSFTFCSYISPLIEEMLEKSSRNENYQNYH